MLRLRAFTYSIVGIICVLFNIAVFNLLLMTGLDTALCNIAAFILGGQLSFILHDRNTFKDRHPSLVGWRRRWVKFMTGNFAVLGVNSSAATVLIVISSPPRLVNIGAMAFSGLFSYAWNNFVSHRDPAPLGVES